MSAPRRAGRGSIVARAGAAADGKTAIARLHAETPLRFLQPTFAGTKGAAVCVVTFGGGLVDGDAIDLDVEVEAGATLVLFTQSTTKAFRGASRQSLRAKVDGRLVWLPDPVAAFKDASYTQSVDVALGPSGSCVLLDGFTSGRAAFGERWLMERLDLRTRITTASGRVVVTDALRLERSQEPARTSKTAPAEANHTPQNAAQTPDSRHTPGVTWPSIAERMRGFDALATLIAVGQGVKPVVDALLGTPIPLPAPNLVVAVSPLPRSTPELPGAIARVAASTPAHAMAAVRSRLRNLPEIDAVDPFTSRY